MATHGFFIQPSSGVPIYRQLADQIRRQCASGQLRPDDPLPSVRDLAGSLGVNPMTISRAYSLLEAEGLLIRRRGIGMKVAGTQPSSLEERLALLDPAIRALARQTRELGVPQPALLEAVRNALTREETADV